MTEACCCPLEAGSMVCDLPSQTIQRPTRVANTCPACGQTGKAVQGQTVKALISVSLREVRDIEYLFCRTQACPVVYFSSDGTQAFTPEQVRERVYQKEPDTAEVFVCYCFRHTVGEVQALSSTGCAALINDIDAGIQAGQCACDLRNPQGSCCLGNARGLISSLAQSRLTMAR